mgnify:CR=1 FL=1
MRLTPSPPRPMTRRRSLPALVAAVALVAMLLPMVQLLRMDPNRTLVEG